MRVALVLVIALATAAGGGVGAMPMAAGMADAGMTRPCADCAPAPGPGAVPICLGGSCIATVATLPAPVVVPAKLTPRPGYAARPPALWTTQLPAPDPFPPRPAALV